MWWWCRLTQEKLTSELELEIVKHVQRSRVPVVIHLVIIAATNIFFDIIDLESILSSFLLKYLRS